VVLEGWPQRIDTPAFDPRGAVATREAYEYLRRLPAGAVLELPTAADRPEREFVYQYMTLVHGHPAVNGHSGYVSPLLLFLGGGGSPLGDLNHVGDAVEMLRAIGVRYLVVHRGTFDDAATADAWVDALGDRRQVLTARSFGDTTVAVLLPAAPLPPPGQGEKIPVAAMRATASQSGDRLASLFDGDRDTRWLSGGQQTGDEWIEVAFDRPHDVREVDLQLAERSFGDYPRQLAVDVVEETGTRTVFRGPVLPQFARGLIVNPDAPVIAVTLTPNRAHAVRLRQVGTTHRFFWSVHELELREAPP
jgi:F5/8 type C domain